MASIIEKREKLLELVCRETGWSKEETREKLNKAVSVGVSYTVFVQNRCWNMDDSQIEQLGRRLKILKDLEPQRLALVKKVCEATGMDENEARRKMEAARKKGLSYTLYVQHKCWNKSDAEILALIKNIREQMEKNETVSTLCRKMGLALPEHLTQQRNVKVTNVTFEPQFVRAGWAVFLIEQFGNYEEKIRASIDKGAVIVFADKAKANVENITEEKYLKKLYLIDNAVEVYGRYYDRFRDAYKGTVISMTGSVGKTTTRHYIDKVVGPVKKWAGTQNFNSTNIVGINARKRMNKNFDVLIQEAGAEGFDTLAMSARILKPDIAVVTNIKAHHLNAYGTIENVYKDKIQLADNVNPNGGVAIVNFDDEFLANHEYKRDFISFGIYSEKDVDYRAINIVQTNELLSLDIVHGDQVSHVESQIVGEHNVYNILAAFIVGKVLNISEDEIAKRIYTYRTAGIRQNVVKHGNNTLFVDCYNVCNDSIIGAVKTLEQMSVTGNGRKIAIIGGENKLGDAGKTVNTELGKALIDSKVDELVVFGTDKTDRASLDRYGDAVTIYNTLVAGGVKNVRLITSFEKMLEYLQTEIKEEDVILFKCVLWLNISAAIDRAFGTEFSVGQAFVRDNSRVSLIDGFKGMTVFQMNEVELFEASDDILHSEKLVIPSSFNGKEIFGIRKGLFKGCGMKAIDFGTTIKLIEEDVFKGCNNLEHLEFPDSLLAVSASAFEGCKNLKSVAFGANIKQIGPNAFAGCDALETVLLPDKYVGIDKTAFPEHVTVHTGGCPSCLTAERLRNQKVKLGFGFNRLPYNKEGNAPDFDAAQEIIDTYLANGCEYFETAYNYMKFQSEDVVKKCLVDKYPRESFILCDKMPIRYQSLYKEGLETNFENRLKKCGVTYFDVYLIHNVGASILPRLAKIKAFEFLQKVKQEGKARLVGISFHDKAEVLDQILTEHPELDVVQLQINYQDWESASIQSRLCYEVAQKHGKIVTVMEPLKGGNLVNKLPQEAYDLIEAHNYTPADLGLRFVASLKDVAVVLSGMGAKQQAEENTKSLVVPCNLEEEGYDVIEKVCEYIKAVKQIDCTNCGYCIEACPKKIPINEIIELLNSETQDGRVINRNAGIFYRSCVNGRGKASDCIKCGLCEDVCSQRLSIREELEKASKLMENLY